MKTYNKLFKNIFFCTVLGATVCSCDLDVEPTSNIATETFWKTEKHRRPSSTGCLLY